MMIISNSAIPITDLGDICVLADRHTLTVQSWLPTRTPQAARYEGVGVTACSSGIPVALLNLALGAHFPPESDTSQIDAEIEAVKAFFAARGVPWYWWVGPTARPSAADFGSRLERHGLICDRDPLPAMVARLPTRFPVIPPYIRVWQATSRRDLETASTIRRVAFRFPEGTALDYFESMADDWLRGDPARLYLAAIEDGPPAAIGALIVDHQEGIPGVYVMATLPAQQRNGLGKAIMARILTTATEEGHTIIVLTAGKQGYPLYRQFGFERVFDYALYRMPT